MIPDSKEFVRADVSYMIQYNSLGEDEIEELAQMLRNYAEIVIEECANAADTVKEYGLDGDSITIVDRKKILAVKNQLK